jgi:DNA replication licensing factor MCM2
VKPKLSSGDLPKISQVYAELRRESVTREGMPVAVRHVESIIRMSEARAAMRLSEHVSSEDIDAAIAVMLASFIGTQKLSVQKSLQKKFARYTHFHRDYDQLLLEILRGIVREMHYWDTVGAGGLRRRERRRRERVASGKGGHRAVSRAGGQGVGVRHKRSQAVLRERGVRQRAVRFRRAAGGHRARRGVRRSVAAGHRDGVGASPRKTYWRNARSE